MVAAAQAEAGHCTLGFCMVAMAIVRRRASWLLGLLPIPSQAGYVGPTTPIVITRACG
jgi:hypothetical protein